MQSVDLIAEGQGCVIRFSVRRRPASGHLLVGRNFWEKLFAESGTEDRIDFEHIGEGPDDGVKGRPRVLLGEKDALLYVHGGVYDEVNRISDSINLRHLNVDLLVYFRGKFLLDVWFNLHFNWHEILSGFQRCSEQKSLR